MSELGIKICNVEHVFKGPFGKRTPTDMCIVELSSNSMREDALKKIVQKGPLKDQGNHELKVDRAKTTLQIQRDSALIRVSDLLKKHDSS